MPQLDLVVYSGLIFLFSLTFFSAFVVFIEFFLPVVLSKLLVIKNFFLTLFNMNVREKVENFNEVFLTYKMHFSFYNSIMYFILSFFICLKYSYVYFYYVVEFLTSHKALFKNINEKK